jgi:anti-sigma-K factor RskA
MRVRVVVGFAFGAVLGWVARAHRDQLAALIEETLERSRAAADALLHGPPPEPGAAPATAPEPRPEPRPEPVYTAPPRPEPAVERLPLRPAVEAAAVPAAVPVIEPNGRRRLAVMFAIAAVLCALVAAGAASWQKWGRNEKTTTTSAAPTTVPSGVASLVRQPGATKLSGRGASTRLTVVVGSGGRAAVVGSNVAQAPSAKTYEVWVIRGGEPRRAALFSGGPGETAVALSRPVPPGATVAVTLEPAGGTASPTGTPLFHVTRSLPPAVLAILAQRNALRLPLTGSRGHVSVVVGRANRAILISTGLTPAPAGKQYEVWVIRGKSVLAAGLFQGGRGRDVIGLARPVPPGSAVAVTLERAGGVSAPTQRPRFLATRG